MLENSMYSVISPEGAAALLWKDARFAKHAVETLKIPSYDLHQLGVIDKIIPEPRGGAHHDLKYQAKNIDIVLEQSLRERSEERRVGKDSTTRGVEAERKANTNETA